MIVDINVHWKPEFFYEDSFFNECIRTIPRGYGQHVDVRDVPGLKGRQLTLSKPKGYENINSEPVATDPNERLKAMDKAGIDKGLLRWCIWPEWATLEICRRINDAMAQSVKQHPDRLLGLAVVPPWDDKYCLEELDRCIQDLGFVGVEVESSYGKLYLDAEEFRPFFKRINQLKVPVIVHHTSIPVDYESIYEYSNLRRMLGRCMEQMICVGRTVYSGMFEELPNLKFIHTMLGGGLFALKGLITPKKSTLTGDRERFDPDGSAKALGFLDRNVYYDVTHAPPWGEPQLECAVKVYGAEHILFGSSYPIRNEWVYGGVQYIRSLDISEKDKSLILGENAVKLFNLK